MAVQLFSDVPEAIGRSHSSKYTELRNALEADLSARQAADPTVMVSAWGEYATMVNDGTAKSRTNALARATNLKSGKGAWGATGAWEGRVTLADENDPASDFVIYVRAVDPSTVPPKPEPAPVAEGEAPPRRRGRPSKAELARRAEAAEAEAKSA